MSDPLDWFSIYKDSGPRPRKQTDEWKPPPFVKNKVAKNILITLALGAGGALVTMNPLGAAYFMIHGAIALALKNLDFKHEIKRLEKRGYVALTKTHEGFVLRLLKKANRRLKGIVLEGLILPKARPWDGKWRLFTFDIPEKLRVARNMLRRKLKDLGMYNMQRSVFVYPYDCRKELEFISDYYRIAQYSTYAEVSFIDIDKALRKYFSGIIKR